MFSFVLGSLAGGAIGWWMAEDATETAGFSGIVLWSTLVAACVIAIVPVELLLRLITRWPANMGGVPRMMAICAITAGAFGASVWLSAADALITPSPSYRLRYHIPKQRLKTKRNRPPLS